MRSLLLLVLLASCDDKPAGRPTYANDQLWKLAPEGARFGIVVSPYAVGTLEDATLVAREFIAKGGPELAPFQERLDALMKPVPNGSNAKLVDVGLVRERGGAAFFGADGMLSIVVLPVADRAAFVAKAGGKPAADPAGFDRIGEGDGGAYCKLVGALYVCGRDEATFAKLGKGTFAASLKKLGSRGDIELVAEMKLGDQRSTVIAAAQLERGQLAVRGLVLNPPASIVKGLGTPVRPRTAIGKSAGFGVLDVRPIFADAPPLPLVEGVTLVDVAKTFSGPLTVTIPAGELTLEIELPLSDPAPLTKVLAGCDQVAMFRQFEAKLVNGGCRIQVPEAGYELDLWIADGKLRIGRKGSTATGKNAPFSPIATELASQPWGFVMWGRGSSFASTGAPPSPPPTNVPPQALALPRANTLLNELGLAMRKETTKDGDAVRFVLFARTLFANPPAIIEKARALTVLEVASNNAWPKAKPIAEAHPGSLFAYDYAAGQSGITLTQYLIASGSPYLMQLIFGDNEPTTPERPPAGMATEGAVRQYATIVYPRYLEANATKPCPTMAELAAFISPEAPTTDEWGNPLTLLCGKDLPAGATGIAILSPGPDGQLGTPDDIKSF